MSENTILKSHSHSVFRLHYHLVVVTKYRRQVLTKLMLEELHQIFSRLCESWGGSLTEFSGGADHVHLLFEGHPNMEIAKFVNNLKTVSSRLLRRDFASYLEKFYSKSVLWSGSYCVLSTGGAPLEVIRQYIQGQTQPE
jgi:putative transposase